jgi:hypothetical protein
MKLNIVTLSGLRVGRYYKLVSFPSAIPISDIYVGKIDSDYESQIDTLGELLEIRQYENNRGTAHLIFRMNDGTRIELDSYFGLSAVYMEYYPENEEISKKRIQDRTRLIRDEIIGNDWALRPENVVATQGLDINHFGDALR